MTKEKLLPREVEQLVLALSEDLSTPTSLGIYLRVKYGCWDQLAAKQVSPEHYLHERAYWRDCVITSLLRKCQDLPTSIDRKAAALDNFWLAEKQCYRTNQRLGDFLYAGACNGSEERIFKVILKIRKKIADILGACPDLCSGRFGPGSTFGDRGRFTLVPDKISSRPTLTPDSLPFLFQWSGTAWATSCASESRDPLFVRGNRFLTVPKDATKDRGIAVEPSLNVFYQLAYGGVIRERLKRIGINLNHGQDIHRSLARKGSADGSLATIDLSNASDTVSTALVKLLLPSRWHDILSMLRSPYTLVKGKWVLLEKFSSMGNGYTFELETLLFFAITSVIVEESQGFPIRPSVDVCAYGDDIILPAEYYSEVKSALEFFGFSVNERKSFSTGPFKESCGGDYWGGRDVRPFFLKEYPSEPQDFITIANGLRRMAVSDSYDPDRASALSRARAGVLNCIPADLRSCRGPKDLGDSVIHEPETRWRTRWRHSIRYIRTVGSGSRDTVSWRNFKPSVVLASALYLAGGTTSQKPFSPVGSPCGDAAGLIPRDAVRGYKVRWVPYS
jgi:hypothetical protein